MDSSISSTEVLLRLLAESRNLIGEIVIGSNFSLRHYKDIDVDVSRLVPYDVAEAAREIARYDVAGCYRPLKTAPNLSRGWILRLNSIEEVVLALDFFYPSALNLYGSLLRKELRITSLRETLNRQTGMYRIAQKIDDEKALALIDNFCCSEKKCLRQVLWKVNANREITTLPKSEWQESSSSQEIPLLCREACNLLVAAIRSEIKKEE